MNNRDKQYLENSERAERLKKLLFASGKFNTDIATIRKKWGLPEVDFATEGDDKKLINWLNKQPQAEIRKDVVEVVKKYKLGPSWIEGVYMYLLWNNPAMLAHKNTLDISTITNEDTGIEELWVRIDPDSSQKDIKAAWNLVSYNKPLLDYASKKKLRRINKEVEERDKYAFDLQQQGLTLAEIADRVSERFNGLKQKMKRAKKANDEDDGGYWWSDVSKMIERHKKRLDIN